MWFQLDTHFKYSFEYNLGEKKEMILNVCMTLDNEYNIYIVKMNENV